MISKKYELLPTTRCTPEAKPLWKIRAIRDFADVRAGDLGVFVEGEHNLPHQGTAWKSGSDALRQWLRVGRDPSNPRFRSADQTPLEAGNPAPLRGCLPIGSGCGPLLPPLPGAGRFLFEGDDSAAAGCGGVGDHRAGR
jgi:hypothetical protein